MYKIKFLSGIAYFHIREANFKPKVLQGFRTCLRKYKRF
jgi:hypothetical protein